MKFYSIGSQTLQEQTYVKGSYNVNQKNREITKNKRKPKLQQVETNRLSTKYKFYFEADNFTNVVLMPNSHKYMYAILVC